MAHELRAARRITADARSFIRLALDVVHYRLLGMAPLPRWNAARTIRLQAGVDLTYRLNRGDIWTVREVWMEDVYRPPFNVAPRTIVDLGGNIGLTAVWFAHRYPDATLLAVEPVPANAALLRKNLAANGIAAKVVEAAIGPSDCQTRFLTARESTVGRVDAAGEPVRQVSMATVLEAVPGGKIDLLKVDIEGAEQALFESDDGWLERVGAMIVEFHPELVDYEALVRHVESRGFAYVPSDSAWPGSMDAFVRVRRTATT
jgi:FkbM family methyltransferase